MMQGTTQKRFEKVDHNFGTKSITEVIHFEFPVLAGVVEHVQKGCGCTDAYFDNGVIKGSLNLKAATGELKEDSKSIIKTVTVYFKDGQDLKIQEGLKSTYNTNKLQETLTIRGVVTKE